MPAHLRHLRLAAFCHGLRLRGACGKQALTQGPRRLHVGAGRVAYAQDGKAHALAAG